MGTGRRMSRRAWLSIAAALMACGPLAAKQIDISGTYRAEGRNPNGSAYTGSAVVSEMNGIVQVQWTVGSQSYAGTGRRDGQVVVVNWGQPAPVIYVVMSNGDLYGTWENGTALERLLRQ